jgi:hypothetical protein
MLADKLQTFRLKASGCSDGYERKILLIVAASSGYSRFAQMKIGI